jgi:hypothetical protein
MFQAVGARVPDAIARPLAEGVWPLIRGDRPLPGWVFGNRYARNLSSMAWPEGVKSLPLWAGWAQFLPLVVFQGLMLGGMIRLVREPIIAETPPPAPCGP